MLNKYLILKWSAVLLLLLQVFVINSCIIVKHDDEDEILIEPEVDISPKPILKLSDLMIRSEMGDMIAFLPEGWFLVDVENKLSNEIIAVAVNPEYNLSAVFSQMKNKDEIKSKIEQDGLFGLAWNFLSRKESKTAGNVKQIGKYQSIVMGNRRFVKYEYSSTGGAIVSKAATFISTANEYYEFSIVPIRVNDNLLPLQQEINDTFQSILAGIKY